MITANQHEHSVFMEHAAQEIRERRKMLRLTQEDLAAAANVSTRFVGMVEAGKPNVQTDSLERLLNVLGFTLTLGSLQ